MRRGGRVTIETNSFFNERGYYKFLASFSSIELFKEYSKREKVPMSFINELNGTDVLRKIQKKEPIMIIKSKEKCSIVKKEYTYDHLIGDLLFLKNNYNQIAVKIIGKSVMKLPIYEIEIGNGPIHIHLNASFHANEWITSLFLMQFTEYIIINEALKRKKKTVSYENFFSTFTFSIVPMVNPDGVILCLQPELFEREILLKTNEMARENNEYQSWKSNIAGVDLNKQFPANWEVEKERKKQLTNAYRDFPGDKPLSEPESIAMNELLIKKRFDYLFAFHTQGKEVYWGYENSEPRDSEEVANEITGKTNYRSVKTINSHAGYRDWFIHQYKKSGFTIELGKGINPLPLSQYEEIYTDTIELMEVILGYLSKKTLS